MTFRSYIDLLCRCTSYALPNAHDYLLASQTHLLETNPDLHVRGIASGQIPDLSCRIDIRHISCRSHIIEKTSVSADVKIDDLIRSSGDTSLGIVFLELRNLKASTLEVSWDTLKRLDGSAIR
jgi:hypothetical protein